MTDGNQVSVQQPALKQRNDTIKAMELSINSLEKRSITLRFIISVIVMLTFG